jgi:hypothetical protein
MFPGEFSIREYYLSVLGNRDENPDGAMYYNLAVISAGISSLIFYPCLYTLYFRSIEYKYSKVVLVSGLVNGLSVFMAGVFPEVPYSDAHFISSVMIFISLIPLLVSINKYLIDMNQKLLGYYGIGVALFNVYFVTYIFTIGTDTGAINEVISLFTYQLWIVILSLYFFFSKDTS